MTAMVPPGRHLLRAAIIGTFLTSFSNSAGASETMRMCRAGERNGPEKHCLVDGDTIWIHGSNIRLEGFDTPEPRPRSAAARRRSNWPTLPATACWNS
jgi:endonuclease YncB( thermonuclease family)